MLLCTSILAVYYLKAQQLPYLLSISSILKDYWGTNPKFCFILHFYCLSTIFHSTCLCPLSFILTLPPCSLLPLFESEFITQYFARSWINTRLALLALPCSRSFAEVSPRLTQNIRSTPKYQTWRGFFILFYLMLSQTTLLFFFNGVNKTISRGFTRMATQISNTAVDENNKQWCFHNDFLMQSPTLDCLKGAFILSRLLWCYFSATVIFIHIFNKIYFILLFLFFIFV